MAIPQRKVGPAEGWWVPWLSGGDSPQELGTTCDLSFINAFSYSIILLFPLWSDIICYSDWTALAVICHTYFTMIFLKHKNVCKSGVLSFTRLFSIKCNLGYQLGPGYELFLIFWKMAKTRKKKQKQTRTKNISFGWKASMLLKRINFQLFFKKDSPIKRKGFVEKMSIHLKGECYENFPKRPKWAQIDAWIDKRVLFGNTRLTYIGKMNPEP